MRNVSEKFVKKIETYFGFSNVFLNRAFMRYVEKYCRAKQATDDKMAHAQYMQDSYGYKLTK